MGVHFKMRDWKKFLGWWVATGLIFLMRIPTASADDDFQSWNTIEISKRLGKEWEIFCIPEVRIRDDASDVFYHEFRQGVRYKHFKHLQLGLNYLYARNSSSGRVRDEHTGELDVTPKTTVGPWELSLRGRAAMRAVEGSSEELEWQFRLMPKIAYPTKIGDHKITPYIADDWFYDGTRDAFNQNRLYAGTSIPLGQSMGADVGLDTYYMLQHQLGPRDWNSNHILGTKLSIRF